MRVLLVTGSRAEKAVSRIAAEWGCEVFVAPVDIASFIKLEHLKGLKNADLILVPGYSDVDLELLENLTGIRSFLGPKDISNLSMVLENLSSINLSKTQPACTLLKGELKRKALQDVALVDGAIVREKLLKRPGNFIVGGLAAGPDFPMRVVAEIVGADHMADNDVLERAAYYLAQGADIIDIGIRASDPERVRELIRVLRANLDAPLSIDTMDEGNIRAAIKAGADMVMSLDEDIIKEIQPTSIPVVIIPGRKEFGSVTERIQALKKNLRATSEKGFTQLIGDPILEPVGKGLSYSIAAYHGFRRLDPTTPLLMGVGNVTELMDADSPGLNAILAGIAMEAGVSLLFTTEASTKTKGSIDELKKASQMMFLSKKRDSLPKDLGIDLLRLKEKTSQPLHPLPDVKTLIAQKSSWTSDKAGNITILTRDDKIIALHSFGSKADIAVEGGNAREIGDTLIRLGLVSSLDHALYLGSELEKAETAIKTGKNYVQDEELFPSR